MSDWSPEQALAHDVRFALTFKIGRRLRPLTDLERTLVAQAIVEYLKLANWIFERGPGLQGHSELASAAPD